jgi:hypothetical protein
MEWRNEKNVYECESCHGQIVTVNADDGTTPYMVRCRVTSGCMGFMASHFYRVDQTLEAQHEWFKPTSLSGYNQATQTHIEKGGLLLRKINGESDVPVDA